MHRFNTTSWEVHDTDFKKFMGISVGHSQRGLFAVSGSSGEIFIWNSEAVQVGVLKGHTSKVLNQREEIVLNDFRLLGFYFTKIPFGRLAIMNYFAGTLRASSYCTSFTYRSS